MAGSRSWRRRLYRKILSKSVGLTSHLFWNRLNPAALESESPLTTSAGQSHEDSLNCSVAVLCSYYRNAAGNSILSTSGEIDRHRRLPPAPELRRPGKSHGRVDCRRRRFLV